MVAYFNVMNNLLKEQSPSWFLLSVFCGVVVVKKIPFRTQILVVLVKLYSELSKLIHCRRISFSQRAHLYVRLDTKLD